MTAKGARTRKYNREFRAEPFFEAVGAKKLEVGTGMGTLPSGRVISFYAGRPGKVAVMLSSFKEERHRQRVFGVNQLDEIREWALAGGVLSKESQRKALLAAAPEMYEVLLYVEKQLERLGPNPEKDHVNEDGTVIKAPPDETPCLDAVRAVLAKARGAIVL